MYRMYVDEVGHDGLTNLDKDKHQFLSLTGLAVHLDHVRDSLEPNISKLKGHVLGQDPDERIILHRTDILGRKGCFGCLSDEKLRDRFDRSVLKLVDITDFKLITAVVDKKSLLLKAKWKNNHPYHLLMDILVEKYTRILERVNDFGDVMPERRGSPKDEALQEAFEIVREKGTYFVASDRIKHRLKARNLKFRWKKENISGLQLCDLLAHPSHMIVRDSMRHDVNLGVFTSKLKPILMDKKYDRSGSGRVMGYGIKYLP